MAWFFSEEEIRSEIYLLSEENQKHARVLRLRDGEAVTVITPNGEQCDCAYKSGGTLRVLSRKPCENEPDVFVTLYQALPKGDKMDTIVQKCVELGISRIVPMLSARCVSRPDEKSLRKNDILLRAGRRFRQGYFDRQAPNPRHVYRQRGRL